MASSWIVSTTVCPSPPGAVLNSQHSKRELWLQLFISVKYPVAGHKKSQSPWVKKLNIKKSPSWCSRNEQTEVSSVELFQPWGQSCRHRALTAAQVGSAQVEHPRSILLSASQTSSLSHLQSWMQASNTNFENLVSLIKLLLFIQNSPILKICFSS